MQTIGRYPRYLLCGHKRELLGGTPPLVRGFQLTPPELRESELTLPHGSLTNFNVAISIISLFTLLTKMITFIMKLWYPIISLFMSLAMTGLYATSIYGQAGPDYADSRYPSSSPWYIRLSCDVAKPYGAVSKCMMAKGTFSVTALML